MKVLSIVVLAAFAALASAAVHSKDVSTGLYWDDAFPPGAAQLPQICLDIACVDSDLCFIAGGSNGVGFGIYSYDGKLNGNVVEMQAQNQSMMILSIEAGGSASAPHGAAGGVGTFFTSGFVPEHYYDATTKTWMPSAYPFELAIASPSTSATKDGNTVVVIDGGSSSGILLSSDGGRIYTLQPTTGFPSANFGNCSTGNIVEVIDSNTWYIIFGQEPQTPSASSSSASSSFDAVTRRTARRHNTEVTLDVTSGEPRVSAAPVKRAAAVKSGETCVGYSYQIVKTTNGGSTYTAQIEQANASFTFYDLACLDAEHCVAVGGNDFESVVYMTKDGQTWKKVYTVSANANGTVDFSEVAYVNATDIWIGGSMVNDAAQTAAGLFYYSRDGGRTWFEYTHLQYAVATVMSVNFPTADVGFATGITQEQSSSILKYAPQPYHGYFAQKQCLNVNCSFLCEEMYFPQGLCIEGGSGGIIATCTASGLEVQSFETTSCIGSHNTSTAPINTCLQSSGGGGLPYFENICNVDAIRKEEPQRAKAGAKMLV